MGLVVALVVAIGSVGGCSRGDSGSDLSSEPTRSIETKVEEGTSTTAEVSTTVEITTTTKARTPEEEVEAAYLDAMAAYFDRLAAPTESSLDEIERMHAGASLLVITEETARFLRSGLVARFGAGGPPIPVVSDVQVLDGSAGMAVCLVDDVSVVDGEGVVIDSTVATKEFRVIVEKVEGAWKVKEQMETGRRPGHVECG